MNAPTKMTEQMPWSREEFEANLRAKGTSYHINHSFNIKMNEGEPHTLVARLQKSGQFPTARELNTIDGVRAEYADGFGLVRASNTTPVVVLRFEADTKEALQRIQEEFKAALKAAWPGIDTNFTSGH